MEFLFLGTEAHSSVPLPLLAASVVIASSVALALLFLRRSPTTTASTATSSTINSPVNTGPAGERESVLSQISQTERLRLQSRVANAKSAEDLYCIFDDFEALHRLDLPVEQHPAGQSDDTAAEQAFRDLVRDKISIDDEAVLIGAQHAASPAAFRAFFHGLVQGVVDRQLMSSLALVQQRHEEETSSGVGSNNSTTATAHSPSRLEVLRASPQLDASRLATHVCCHLARTRAGGDTFFCLTDIFDSPQVCAAWRM
jgi:hypothetical protein